MKWKNDCFFKYTLLILLFLLWQPSCVNKSIEWESDWIWNTWKWLPVTWIRYMDPWYVPSTCTLYMYLVYVTCACTNLVVIDSAMASCLHWTHRRWVNVYIFYCIPWFIFVEHNNWLSQGNMIIKTLSQR